MTRVRSVGQFAEVGLVDDWIDGILGGEGVAGHREVGPRRQATQGIFAGGASD
jgi:hypothetical protein